MNDCLNTNIVAIQEHLVIYRVQRNEVDCFLGDMLIHIVILAEECEIQHK